MPEGLTAVLVRPGAPFELRTLPTPPIEILRVALSEESSESVGLSDRVHLRFAALGGVNLKLPDRGPPRRPHDL